MPIRAAVAADAAGVASCINEMYAYLRARGALLDGIADWDVQTVQAWAQSGYRAWVYAATAAGGRVDAVCVYGVENYNRRGLGMEPWMALKVLAVRAVTIPDTGTNHETHTLRALKLSVPDAVQRSAAVGIVAEYHANWRRLDTFLDGWPGQGNTREVSPDGRTVRRWIILKPGLTDLVARTAGVSNA